MASAERREHERIEIELATRMWVDEARNGKDIQFEGYARTQDLSIGGSFIDSNYLLPVGFAVNLELRMGDEEVLHARGQVIHVADDGGAGKIGMGVQFIEVDAENRERLLRFFVSDRIRDFYNDRFIIEFPHLENIFTLKDVALCINLWEDKQGRVAAMRSADKGKGVAANASAAAREKAKRGSKARPGLRR